MLYYKYMTYELSELEQKFFKIRYKNYSDDAFHYLKFKLKYVSRPLADTMRFDVDVAVQDSTIIAPGDCDFLTEIKGSSIKEFVYANASETREAYLYSTIDNRLEIIIAFKGARYDRITDYIENRCTAYVNLMNTPFTCIYEVVSKHKYPPSHISVENGQLISKPPRTVVVDNGYLFNCGGETVISALGGPIKQILGEDYVFLPVRRANDSTRYVDIADEEVIHLTSGKKETRLVKPYIVLYETAGDYYIAASTSKEKLYSDLRAADEIIYKNFAIEHLKIKEEAKGGSNMEMKLDINSMIQVKALDKILGDGKITNGKLMKMSMVIESTGGKLSDLAKTKIMAKFFSEKEDDMDVEKLMLFKQLNEGRFDPAEIMQFRMMSSIYDSLGDALDDEADPKKK